MKARYRHGLGGEGREGYSRAECSQGVSKAIQSHCAEKRRTNNPMKLSLRLLFVIFCFAFCASAQTYTYKVAYSFSIKGNAGGLPSTSLLIVDNTGYGAADGIYQAKSSGVHRIVGCCSTNAGLISDSSGNLYEVFSTNGSPGGVIEFLSPTWTRQILYRFTGGNDGSIFYQYEAPLLFDSAGNLWSTAYGGGGYPCNNGGNAECGVVYELVNNQGTWSEQVIHAFSGPPDGANSVAGLTYDAATGVYYGTTEFGGDMVCNCGTVFELTPNGNGTWTESVIYSFTNQADGGLPMSGLILDNQGNLYGTTWAGGQSENPDCGCGTVYEISSAGQFSVLHAFAATPYDDGQYVSAPLVFDGYGTLWGTTYFGGVNSNRGTIFNLVSSGGTWQYSLFHSFEGQQRGKNDGATASTGLTLDGAGNLWGTTRGGGSAGYGTIYEIAVAP